MSLSQNCRMRWYVFCSLPAQQKSKMALPKQNSEIASIPCFASIQNTWPSPTKREPPKMDFPKKQNSQLAFLFVSLQNTRPSANKQEPPTMPSSFLLAPGRLRLLRGGEGLRSMRTRGCQKGVPFGHGLRGLRLLKRGPKRGPYF